MDIFYSFQSDTMLSCYWWSREVKERISKVIEGAAKWWRWWRSILPNYGLFLHSIMYCFCYYISQIVIQCYSIGYMYYIHTHYMCTHTYIHYRMMINNKDCWLKWSKMMSWGRLRQKGTYLCSLCCTSNCIYNIYSTCSQENICVLAACVYVCVVF